MMLKFDVQKLGGVWSAMPTPFSADGKLDHEAIIRWLTIRLK